MKQVLLMQMRETEIWKVTKVPKLHHLISEPELPLLSSPAGTNPSCVFCCLSELHIGISEKLKSTMNNTDTKLKKILELSEKKKKAVFLFEPNHHNVCFQNPIGLPQS